MMKKTYIIPCTGINLAQAGQMLASSGVSGSGNGINIGYGGVDTDGEQDPSVKESDWDIWGEE